MATERQHAAVVPEPSYRTLVEHANEGIAVMQDARFVFANPAIGTLSGRPTEEIVGLAIDDVFHPEDAPQAAARHAARARGEPVESRFDIRVVRPDGEVRWVCINVVAIDWNGRPASLGLVTDVTERRHAEEALRRSEEKHRLVVENATEGISVIADQRFLFANARMGVITGYRPEELLAMPSAVSLVYPDDRALVGRIHGGPAPRGAFESRNEFRLVHKSGRVVWVADNAVAIEWQGRPATLSFTSDVTARKELETRLKSSLVERETILQSALVGIGYGVNRRYQWVNRKLEELLGYDPGELVGQSSRLEFEDEAAWRAFGEEAYPQLAAGRPYRGDLRMRRKDGSFIWLEVCGIALDPRDLSQGTIWTYLDVSERRKAEEETRTALEKQRQLNELKSRFVSMTSHEFRTPLAAILSSAELLKRYPDRLPAAEKAELHASIEAGVKRMTALLDNVLTFGRAESGRLEYEPRTLDLRGLCEEIIDELRRARLAEGDGRHAIELEWHLPGRNACVDEKLLRQILGNLLSNAVKYSPAGGRVALEVRRQDSGLSLVVTDEGIGIPPEDLPDLFGVFHRAGNVGAIAGTGLGLAIVKRAVERHGGTVEASSTLGHGSRFAVQLPADGD
jgi:PAS domain S-box-containing protein